MQFTERSNPQGRWATRDTTHLGGNYISLLYAYGEPLPFAAGVVLHIQMLLKGRDNMYFSHKPHGDEQHTSYSNW